MRRRSLAGSPEEHASAELEAAGDARKRVAAVRKALAKDDCVGAGSELVFAAQAVGEARANRRWMPRAAGKGSMQTPLAAASNELDGARSAFNMKCLVGPGLDGAPRRRRRSRK
jgi:hypothetical protein